MFRFLSRMFGRPTSLKQGVTRWGRDELLVRVGDLSARVVAESLSGPVQRVIYPSSITRLDVAGGDLAETEKATILSKVKEHFDSAGIRYEIA